MQTTGTAPVLYQPQRPRGAAPKPAPARPAPKMAGKCEYRPKGKT